MQTIAVKAFNDRWYNREEVQQQLESMPPRDPVCFKILEGVCAYHTGIYQFIRDWQSRTRRSDQEIFVDTLNKTQPLPWKNINSKSVLFSEHLIDSRVYAPKWHHQDRSATARKFALFVGRRSIERCVMLHDCSVEFGGEFLISAMATDQRDIFEPDEEFERWGDQRRREQIRYWNSTSCPGSLDSYHARDIYVNYETFHFITSLNPFYHLFDIELVAETMIRGATFWPTEKIVRPIVAKKPWLVMGARGFLANLREIGFRTFGDYWDERYDVLEGEHRWEAIRNVIGNLANMPQPEFHNMLQHLTTVCEHNYNHLRTWWNNG